MSHYAKVRDGIVVDVIVANADYFVNFRDTSPGTWLQTSYNTNGNVHPAGTPLRGNYAGIGYKYDHNNDVFYSPQPYPSWTLNTNTWTWEAPVPYPVYASTPYIWNEAILNWIS